MKNYEMYINGKFTKAKSGASRDIIDPGNGELIAQGKPHEVTHDPRVVEVYLGTDAHAVQQQTKALAEGSGGPRA